MTKRMLSQAPTLHYRPVNSRGWIALGGLTGVASPGIRRGKPDFGSMTLEFAQIGGAVLGVLKAAALASRNDDIAMMFRYPDGTRQTWRARLRDLRVRGGLRPDVLDAEVTALVMSRRRAWRAKP